MSSVWGTHSCFPEGRGNLIMSSTGGTYSSLPLGEHIHVFRWGALFQSSDGGTHSCLPLGGLIPVFRWGALFMFSVRGLYSCFRGTYSVNPMASASAGIAVREVSMWPHSPIMCITML